MATIGTFTKADNGNFAGTITTMTLKAKTVYPSGRQGKRQGARLHRLTVGAVECGAGWQEDQPREPRVPLSQAGRSDPSRLRSTPP